MVKIFSWALLSMCILFVMDTAMAKQESSPKMQAQISERMIAAKVPDKVWTDKDLEIALLKEQNKVIKEYQSDLLSTVYWALGSILGLLAIFLGLNWWSNKREYEKDKAQFEKNLNTRLSEEQSLLDLKLEKARADIAQVTDAKNDVSQDRLNTEIHSIRTELTADRDRASAEFLDVRKLLSEARNEIIKRDAIREASVRQIEEYVWEMKGSKGNLLLTIVQGASIYAEIDAGDAVKLTLNRAIELANTMIKDKTICAKQTRESCKYYLEILMETYPEEAGLLLKQLAELNVPEQSQN